MTNISTDIYTYLCLNDGYISHMDLYYKLYNNEKTIKHRDVCLYTLTDIIEHRAEYLYTLNNIKKKYDLINIIKIKGIYFLSYDVSVDEMVNDIKVFENPDNFLKQNKLIKYIIKNNLDSNYLDMETGNSIYHTIIINKNYKIIKKLLIENKMNLSIVNNKNETPLTYINDNKLLILLIDNINNKNIIIENKMISIDSIILKIYDINYNINRIIFKILICLLFSNIIIIWMIA